MEHLTNDQKVQAEFDLAEQLFNEWFESYSSKFGGAPMDIRAMMKMILYAAWMQAYQHGRESGVRTGSKAMADAVKDAFKKPQDGR